MPLPHTSCFLWNGILLWSIPFLLSFYLLSLYLSCITIDLRCINLDLLCLSALTICDFSKSGSAQIKTKLLSAKRYFQSITVEDKLQGNSALCAWQDEMISILMLQKEKYGSMYTVKESCPQSIHSASDYNYIMSLYLTVFRGMFFLISKPLNTEL